MPKRKALVIQKVKETVQDMVDIALREETEEGRTPGKIVRGVKTSWNRKDIEAVFPICEFTPEETIPVTYQGIRYQLFAGVSMLAPTIIKDIYLEHRRRMRNIGRSLQSMNVEVLGGAGALEPEK